MLLMLWYMRAYAAAAFDSLLICGRSPLRSHSRLAPLPFISFLCPYLYDTSTACIHANHPFLLAHDDFHDFFVRFGSVWYFSAQPHITACNSKSSLTLCRRSSTSANKFLPTTLPKRFKPNCVASFWSPRSLNIPASFFFRPTSRVSLQSRASPKSSSYWHASSPPSSSSCQSSPSSS